MAVVIIVPSTFGYLGASVASAIIFRSDTPINSSTDEVLKFTAVTHTVTAHYFYPPSVSFNE